MKKGGSRRFEKKGRMTAGLQSWLKRRDSGGRIGHDCFSRSAKRDRGLRRRKWEGGGKAVSNPCKRGVECKS